MNTHPYTDRPSDAHHGNSTVVESTTSRSKEQIFNFYYTSNKLAESNIISDGSGTVVPEGEGKGAPGLAAACSHGR